MRILLVEDDLTLVQQLRRGLTTDGVTVVNAPTVSEAQAVVEIDDFTAIILDLAMPDGTGLEVLRQVRARNHAVPVLVLSGIDREDVVIRLLDAGADDYLVKPVSFDLLRARLRALVRRGSGAPGAQIRIGPLVVDTGRRQVWLDGRPVQLSSLEFAFLAHLARHAGTPQSQRVLLRDVWGHESHEGGNVVAVTAMRVRRRLGTGPNVPSIESVRGAGYVLRTAEAPIDLSPHA